MLKIDQSFVNELGTDAEATAIVTSVVHLARALGLEVVAEGVETREQLTHLDLLGCRLAQGFYWSRPVPPVELEARLELDGAEAGIGVADGPSDRITVLVADDHPDRRASIVATLQGSGRFAVVGEAEDGRQAVRLAEQCRPELMVLDLTTSRMEGLEELPRLLASSPRTKIALMSSHGAPAALAPGTVVDLSSERGPAGLVDQLMLVMGGAPPGEGLAPGSVRAAGRWS